MARGRSRDTTASGKAAEEWVRTEGLPAFHPGTYAEDKVVLSAGGTHLFDAVDLTTGVVANVSTGGKSSGAYDKVRSDMLFLTMARDVTVRVMVLTDPKLHEYFERQRKDGRVPKSVKLVHMPLPPGIQDLVHASKAQTHENQARHNPK